MAKITQKASLNIKGIFHLDPDGKVLFEVEDVEELVELANLAKDFDGEEVSLSIQKTVEVA